MAQLKRVGTTGSVNGTVMSVNNMQEVMDAIDNSLDMALTKIGIKAEKYAKARCPVGTVESTGKKGYRGGTLRNSITFVVEGKKLYIGSNVEYAPYVELGTGPYFNVPPEWEHFKSERGTGVGHGYVKPRPYLRPAVEDHIDEYRRIIKKEFE